MNMALKMTAAYLDSKSLKYTVYEDDRRIRISYLVDNKGSLEVIVIFDEDEGSVALRSFDFCKVPEAKTAAIYEMCSKMNKEYRWIKFFLDERDNTITLAEDAVIQLDSCGEEILDLINRMVRIGDDAYPAFMKAIWA
jgi:hypothetical protein